MLLYKGGLFDKTRGILEFQSFVNRAAKMKVFLLVCIIFGASNATLPGLSGDAASNILQDLLGGTQGFVRFLRGNTNRLQGGGGGEIVDGKGAGIGQQTSNGYGYEAPVSQTSNGYGYEAPASQINNGYAYEPPAPQINNGYAYEPPAPKPVYGPPPVQQVVEPQYSYLPPAPINPQPQYGPPPTLPPVPPKPVYVLLPVQETYLPPVNPQPQYGPPQVQQQVSVVESSYLPPPPVNPQPCYGTPSGEQSHSSSQGSSSGFSEQGSSGGIGSSGSLSGSSGLEEIFK